MQATIKASGPIEIVTDCMGAKLNIEAPVETALGYKAVFGV